MNQAVKAPIPARNAADAPRLASRTMNACQSYIRWADLVTDVQCESSQSAAQVGVGAQHGVPDRTAGAQNDTVHSSGL